MRTFALQVFVLSLSFLLSCTGHDNAAEKQLIGKWHWVTRMKMGKAVESDPRYQRMNLHVYDDLRAALTFDGQYLAGHMRIQEDKKILLVLDVEGKETYGLVEIREQRLYWHEDSAGTPGADVHVFKKGAE